MGLCRQFFFERNLSFVLFILLRTTTKKINLELYFAVQVENGEIVMLRYCFVSYVCVVIGQAPLEHFMLEGIILSNPFHFPYEARRLLTWILLTGFSPANAIMILS